MEIKDKTESRNGDILCGQIAADLHLQPYFEYAEYISGCANAQMQQEVGKKHYESAEELTKKFIDDGWGKDTIFSELTMQEAEEKGYLFAKRQMEKGRKYFMKNNGNLYDDTGKIAVYNVKRMP